MARTKLIRVLTYLGVLTVIGCWIHSVYRNSAVRIYFPANIEP